MALQLRNMYLFSQVFYNIIQSDLFPDAWSKQRSIIGKVTGGEDWNNWRCCRTKFNCIGKLLSSSRTGIIEDGGKGCCDSLYFYGHQFYKTMINFVQSMPCEISFKTSSSAEHYCPGKICVSTLYVKL